VGDSLDEARGELRARQGAGARYDAASASARELDWARRGTAYFTRLLNGLDEGQLDDASEIAGVPRRRIVAYIGLEGRLLAELVGRAALPQPEASAGPIPGVDALRSAVSLPTHALRNLFNHSAVHLDVEWRDLDEAQWQASVKCPTGENVVIAQTPLLRAISIWQAAGRLRVGARSGDVPIELMGLLTTGADGGQIGRALDSAFSAGCSDPRRTP
jgi:maleylpyruvate isomerase